MFTKFHKEYYEFIESNNSDIREKVKVLLEQGMLKTDKDHYALFGKLFFEAKKANSNKNDSLYLTLKDLIEYGADINQKDAIGFSPLQRAIASSMKTPFKLLLIDSGADINTQSTEGLSLLHTAVRYHDLKMVDVLLKNGIDIALKCQRGLTAKDHAKEMIEQNIMPELNSMIVESIENEEVKREKSSSMERKSEIDFFTSFGN